MRHSIVRPSLRLLGASFGLVTFSVATTVVAAHDVRDDVVTAIPAGTELHFHLSQAVSSDGSKRGDPFSFVMTKPLTIGDREIVAVGAIGTGTILVAGHAGGQGHEGDISFELDSLPTTDGRSVAFDGQRFEMNGRNRKIASNVLGFVPYVGLAAMLIKGSNERVDPSQEIETTLQHAAPIASVTVEPDSSASFSPSSSPSATASISPSP